MSLPWSKPKREAAEGVQGSPKSKGRRKKKKNGEATTTADPVKPKTDAKDDGKA